MTKVLFVCMGNICRSPAAEGIFKNLINKSKLEDEIKADSAGTVDYHSGELPDKRMRKHAEMRGYILDSRARKFDPKNDFEEFDFILTMDNDNYHTITSLVSSKTYHNKILKMTDFSSDKTLNEVPDPYYGDKDGFENVLDILEDSTKNLLKKIKEDLERRDKI